MNNLDKQYTALLQDILDNGVKKEDRTGTGTISVFGRQIRHKMSEGFPLLTTKKMYFKGIVTELLWFLRGDTNIKFLVDNDCHIWDGDAYKNFEKWYNEHSGKEDYTGYYVPNKEEFIRLIKTDDEFAKKWGELGPVYGKQWRAWGGYEKVPNGWTHGAISSYKEVPKHDQIANLINDLKTNPDSRRLMVNAWNVGELDSVVLPPCHYGFQVYTRELSLEERLCIADKFNPLIREDCLTKTHHPDETEEFKLVYRHEFLDSLGPNVVPQRRAISLMWNQRSVDTFLGLPFNIASYGLLLEIIAKEVNMVPDELIGYLGDVHLYSNHIEQAKEQIGQPIFEESPTLYPNGFMSEGVKKKIQVGHTRGPYPLPKLNFGWFIESWTTEEAKEMRKDSFDSYIRQMKPTDFILENYQSHPTIKAPLSN